MKVPVPAPCERPTASRYMTLGAAVTWALYRGAAPPNGLLGDYDPTVNPRMVDAEDFREALVSGKLEAWGQAERYGDSFEKIEPIRWITRTVSTARLGVHGSYDQVWVERAAVERLWPAGFKAKRGRPSDFNWPLVKRMVEEERLLTPGVSDHKIIDIIGVRYPDEESGHPAPSRSSIKAKLKAWRASKSDES